MLVVDETGFIKKGIPSVGVQRQYSGTAGKVDNCQLGVFLAYASGRGRAFIDPGAVPAALVDQRPGAGRRGTVPEQVGSRTKPQLARVMLERALDAEVPGRPGRLSPGRARRGFPQLLVWLGARQRARRNPLGALQAGPKGRCAWPTTRDPEIKKPAKKPQKQATSLRRPHDRLDPPATPAGLGRRPA